MASTQSPPAKRARMGERTMLACIKCKQKKLKCDGQSPKCQNCVKSSSDCLIEDPATGMHRPRDYMQSLESRIAYLEGLLQDARPDVASDHLGNLRRLGDGQAEAAFAPSSHNYRTSGQGDVYRRTDVQSVSNTNTDPNHVSSEVALLCVSASGREPQYFGPSSAVSFARIAGQIMGLPSQNAGFESSDVRPQIQNNNSRNERASTLRHPTPEVANNLTRAYFENIHLQYPFLHQATFDAWAKACMEANIKGSLTSVDHIPLFFVTMVYGIGSLALGEDRSDEAGGYYAMALDHIGPILNTNSLESIQAVLACAVFSVRSRVGGNLWQISGIALRQCVELGYHRSTQKFRKNAGLLFSEMAKRCFWTAYDIDRVASFILGRPGGIPDHAIDVELPLDIDDERLGQEDTPDAPGDGSNNATFATTMTGAIHVIKLRCLWSRFNTYLYQSPASWADGFTSLIPTVVKLRMDLDAWRDSTPNQLDFSHSKPLSVFASHGWFALAYAHSVLLLYRPFITGVDCYNDLPLADHNFTEQAFEQCYIRSREMCVLYRRLYQKPSIQFTWGSLHILFLGGMTYLYCLWRSPKIRQGARQSDVMNTCMACNTVLIIIAERWKLATAYRDMFEKLSERTISMLETDASRQRALDSAAATTYGAFDSSAFNDPLLEDWILDLDNINIPNESEWLVQELVQGVRDFESTT